MRSGGQAAHDVRFEWGARGAAAIADGADVVVVVDVLAGSTSVADRLDSGEPVVTLDPDAAADRLAGELQGYATTVVTAGLRNARAVADWIAREHDEDTATVAVVALGETWPDGSLRPALEDLWGAGAVLAALEDHGWPGLSPEAASAADAYRLIAGREAGHLRACASGAALLGEDRGDELARAATVGASTTVPLLGTRGFVPAP
jgi:2-phosphosulfolactate phosphatase